MIVLLAAVVVVLLAVQVELGRRVAVRSAKAAAGDRATVTNSIGRLAAVVDGQASAFELAAVKVDEAVRGSVLASRVRHEMVVTLKSGGTFRGLLVEEDRHALVFRNAVMLNRANEVAAPTPVDGELILLRADVELLQRP